MTGLARHNLTHFKKAIPQQNFWNFFQDLLRAFSVPKNDDCVPATVLEQLVHFVILQMSKKLFTKAEGQ